MYFHRSLYFAVVTVSIYVADFSVAVIVPVSVAVAVVDIDAVAVAHILH